MRLINNTKRKNVKFRFVVKNMMPVEIPLYVKAWNPDNPTACYLRQDLPVEPNAKREFFIQIPFSPDRVEIEIFNRESGIPANVEDPTFKILVREKMPLHQRWDRIKYKRGIRQWVNFMTKFAEQKGWLSASLNKGFPNDDPSIYNHPDGNGGKYEIHYYDHIRDTSPSYEDANGNEKQNPDYGKLMSTPARINVETKIMEVAASRIRDYTVPMIWAIMTHEGGHGFWNNNKYSEVQADLNSIEILLSLGFPKVEVENAFLSVFAGTPSDQNVERHKILKGYIDRWPNV